MVSEGRGIVVVRLGEDLPILEAAEGVTIAHLVGQGLMFRVLEFAEGASIVIEDDAEHIVTVHEGRLALWDGKRAQRLLAGEAATVLKGTTFTLSSESGSTRCELVSTPPSRHLVRHLLHLEHADHGFD